MQVELDAIDKRILDRIQGDFPLVSRPYAEIGKHLGLGEREVWERVGKMRANGVIRRLGANFQSKKLGFTSTLCAAKVPAEKLDEFINEVNALPGVTHNYLRANDYNVWFTLISPGVEERDATLAELTSKTGVPVLNLPATRMFKIKVDFPMGERET